MLLSINEWGALDLYQIQQLHFASIKTARRRMEILAESKKVNRIRPSIDQTYNYFIGKRPAQLEHRVGTNYARLKLTMNLPWWEKLHSWEYEPQYYDILRPDGFIAIKNSERNEMRFAFIEFDRGFNPFDKVEKYNELFKSGGYKQSWWAPLAIKRFPIVIVISEDVERAQKKYKDRKDCVEFQFLDYHLIRSEYKC